MTSGAALSCPGGAVQAWVPLSSGNPAWSGPGSVAKVYFWDSLWFSAIQHPCMCLPIFVLCLQSFARSRRRTQYVCSVVLMFFLCRPARECAEGPSCHGNTNHTVCAVTATFGQARYMCCGPCMHSWKAAVWRLEHVEL